MINDPAPPDLRTKDVFHHIDMGFLNERLCLTAIGDMGRRLYSENRNAGSDHLSILSNRHLLTTILIDLCDAAKAPTLYEALTLGKPRHLFRSTEQLAPCPEVYTANRVQHAVLTDIDFGKPVTIAYHTSHIVSDTGRMTLARGANEGYRESMIGLLHDSAIGLRLSR